MARPLGYRHATDNTQVTSLATSAGRCEWITLQGEWKTDHIAAIRGANPDCKILIYKNLTRMSDPDGFGLRGTAVTATDGQTNGWASEVEDPDVAGEGLIANATDASGYAAAVIAGVLDQLDGVDCDGVFLDDMNHVSDGAVADDGDWRNWLAAVNAIVGPGLASEGLFVVANMSGATGQRNIDSAGWVADQFAHYDGGVDEFFTTFPDGTDQPLPYVEEAADIVAAQQAAGKWYIGMVPCDSETEARFAACLMATQDDGFAGLFTHQTGSTGTELFYEDTHEAIDALGAPLGDAIRVGDVISRVFEGGTVSADLDTRTGTITPGAAMTTLRDDFNRADEGPPVTGWEEADGNQGHTIVSNQLATHATEWTGSRWGMLIPAPQEVSVVVAVEGASGHDTYFTLVDDNDDGYELELRAGTDRWQLIRKDAGVGTALSPTVTQAWTSGDRIGLGFDGDDIVGYLNGVEVIRRTDATHRFPGMWFQIVSEPSSTVRYDDFAATEPSVYRVATSRAAAAQGTTASVTRPSGSATGDRILLALGVEVGTPKPSPPGGTSWNELLYEPMASGHVGAWQVIVWEWVDDGSAGPWSITWGGSNVYRWWRAIAFRSGTGTPVIDDADSQPSGGTSTSIVAPSIDVTDADRLLAYLGIPDGPATATWTPPSGMRPVDTIADSVFYAEEYADAGATGTRTGTISNARWNVGALIALAAGSPGPVEIEPPAAGEVAFTGSAPTVTVTGPDVEIEPPAAGTAAFTGSAPTVEVTGPSVEIEPPAAGVLAFTASAPTIVADIAVIPPAGTIAFSASAPTVEVGAPPAPAPTVAIDYGDDPWATALTRSHEVISKVWLLDGDTETELATVVDGTVTLDANAAIRGRCDLTLADDGTLGLIPTTPQSALAPYGNEIRVERGVRLPDSTELLVSLGVFRLEDVDVDDDAEGLQIRIAGQDRAAWVIDAKFEEPYQIAAGTNYADAIVDTVALGYPAVELGEIATTSLTTPVLPVEEGSDRWEFCQRMAAACGMELFFDSEGKLTLRPVSMFVSGAPVWEIVEGEDGVLIRAGRRWTRQGSPNRVIFTGENIGEDGPPARGVATDDNPLSPTYYYGPFGRVPRFEYSEFVTTDAQALDAASALLARQLGTTEQIDFGALVNPRLTPGDVIRVSRVRAGIDQEDHVIDSLTIPLRADAEMTGNTRATVVL